MLRLNSKCHIPPEWKTWVRLAFPFCGKGTCFKRSSSGKQVTKNRHDEVAQSRVHFMVDWANPITHLPLNFSVKLHQNLLYCCNEEQVLRKDSDNSILWRVCYLCTVGRAVLDDPLQLLMDELHAAQTRLLQSLNLPLHQQLKAHLRNKQRWPWTLPHKQCVTQHAPGQGGSDSYGCMNHLSIIKCFQVNLIWVHQLGWKFALQLFCHIILRNVELKISL